MKIVQRVKGINENSLIVLKNVVISFLVKGGSLCLSLFTTPAFVRYFDNNTILGVWYTLLSVLTWVLNFDLGVGNGIRNNLVKDFANEDIMSARKTISSGLLSSGFLMMVLTAIGTVLINSIDLNSLFNVDKELVSDTVLRQSALLVFTGLMIRFFLSGLSSVFYALQMSSVNNLLSLCVSIFQLLFVVLVKPIDAERGLLILSGAYIVIANFPVCIAGIVVFETKLKECRPSIRYIDRQHISRVMGVGTVFFVCQMMYMLLMNTNELFISRLFGPEYTTEYTFYYKLTSLIYMVASLVLAPIWSVITKAMAEQQYDWVRKLYKKLKIFGILVIVAQFAFIIIQQFVMDIWLGKGSVFVEYPTAIAFACFGSVFIYSSILSTIVCGMSRMKIQLLCYSIGALGKCIFLLLLPECVTHWSVVVWSNVFVLLPYCIIQQLDLDVFFKKLWIQSLEK